MFNRRAGTLCPFCEIQAISRYVTRPSWQQHRSITRMRPKPQPSRMELSKTVSRGPIKPRSREKRDTRSDITGPFAGMNRTDAGVKVKTEQLRQAAREQTKRAKTARNPEYAAGRSGSREHKPKEQRQMKALKMQRALHSIPYGARSEIKQRLEEIDSFDAFPLLPATLDAVQKGALSGLSDVTPTPIQRLAVPALLGYADARGRLLTAPSNRAFKSDKTRVFLLAAETGSGKTLAYTIPLIDSLKRQEAMERESEAAEKADEEKARETSMFELPSPELSNEEGASGCRPRAIILVPTAELVDQVGRLFKTFSHYAKLRVSMISVNYTAATIRSRLFKQPVDVVISTPHLLNSIAEADPNILSKVTHLVCDEADSLLDRSFSPLTGAIVDRAMPSMKQLILCSATIPRSLDGYVSRRFPHAERLATPNLHAIPRRVQLSVVDIDKEPYRGSRDLACADTVWTIGRDGGDAEDATKRVIVFVNEREEADRVAKYLVGKGIDAAPMNRDTDERRSGQLLDMFRSVEPDALAEWSKVVRNAPSTKRVLPNTKVLVMTDIGSRGIDTLPVKHVILYDVPHSSVDFIHRLGRLGRMGKRGRGIVLASNSDRKDVIADVRESMFRGQALV